MHVKVLTYLYRIVAVLQLCLVVFFFFLWPVCTRNPRSLRGTAKIGAPYEFVKDTAYWGEISDFLVCGNFLYVLYGNKDVLQIFNLDGEYIRSFYFQQKNSDRAGLFRTDDMVFLKDKYSNLYQLENGEVTAFLPSDTCSAEIKQIVKNSDSNSAKRTAANGDYYRMRVASIWRTTREGVESCVVYRSILYYPFNMTFGLVYPIIFALLVLLENELLTILRKSK